MAKYMLGKCYYCICTACTCFHCPWRYKLYKQCFYCNERGFKSPRLHCDYFEHYLKRRRFRVKRLPASELHRFGTYLLVTDLGSFKGRFADLVKLKKRLGGKLQQYDIIKQGGVNDDP